MKTNDRLTALTFFTVFTLFLFSAEAAVFDPGVALKADMAQGTPVNPYTDTQSGGWTYAKTTAVTNGTLTLLTKQTTDWGACFKGFSDSDNLPTLQVNTGKVAVVASNGLTDGNHPIAPNEIALHPDNGNQASRFAIIRFVVPRTSVYHVLATFRDVSGGVSNAAMGVDVHVVLNGNQLTNAVVSVDTAAPSEWRVPFTAEYRSLSLNANDTIDFVVGPNGTNSNDHGNDGTALRASVTEQRPYQAGIINLDLNGFNRTDTVPGTNTAYAGAAAVGSDGDYWNTLTISDTNRTSFTIPNLKLSDGLTNSTVRFSIASIDASPLGGDYSPAASWPNTLMNDYAYLSANAGTTSTNQFIVSGLTPGANYDLYFYSNIRGRFEMNGWASDCVNVWFSTNGTKDYVVFNEIAADGNGSITGLFYRAVAGADSVFNGVQIVGSFLRQTADIVNLDIDGYTPGSDSLPGPADTFSGAARTGSAGDYWNSTVIPGNTMLTFSVPKLKLTDGETRSTVCFALTMLGGGKLTADRNSPYPYNALLDDYVYVYSETNQFTLSGLAPNTAYDLYFYCRAGTTYAPGRFIIHDVAYDSIDACFPISATGGDCAVCPGIVADSTGSISGVFCRANPGLPGVFNGFQIIGTIPHLPLGTLIRVQ